jgi:hypothetical protein
MPMHNVITRPAGAPRAKKRPAAARRRMSGKKR